MTTNGIEAFAFIEDYFTEKYINPQDKPVQAGANEGNVQAAAAVISGAARPFATHHLSPAALEAAHRFPMPWALEPPVQAGANESQTDELSIDDLLAFAASRFEQLFPMPLALESPVQAGDDEGNVRAASAIISDATQLLITQRLSEIAPLDGGIDMPWSPFTPALLDRLSRMPLGLEPPVQAGADEGNVQAAAAAVAAEEPCIEGPLPEVRQRGSAEVIIASGPGGRAWDEKLIGQMHRSLDQAGRVGVIGSFTPLGDGKAALSVDQIIESVKIAKEKGEPITLFIQAHGETQGDGEHYLILDDKMPIASRVLFSRLKDTLGEYPISIFTTACEGNAAAKAAREELPRGSIFVALSKSEKPVSGHDVAHFIKQTSRLPSSWHNIENGLYSYLASLEDRHNPSITCVPNKPLELDDSLLHSRTKKKSSPEQQDKVVERLQDFIPEQKVRRLIEKIEAGSYFLAIEYGPALAVALALERCYTKRDSRIGSGKAGA